MATSTVNIITPEDTLSIDANGIPIVNGIPQYQDFIPYVELYAIRNNEIQALMTSSGSTIISGSDKIDVVSFMGYDRTNYPDNEYTSAYTDNITGVVDRPNLDEGFVIRITCDKK